MAYGRIYNVVIEAVAVTAIQDLFEVTNASTKVTVLRALEIGQSSDAKDTEDEQLYARIITGYTTSGSGGSSVTAIPRMIGMAAYAGSCERNNTTVANTGTAVVHRAFAFNVRAGYVWQPSEDEMIVLAPSERAVVHLPAAPADSLTISATLTIEEIG
jgi:hypothetical protein